MQITSKIPGETLDPVRIILSGKATCFIFRFLFSRKLSMHFLISFISKEFKFKDNMGSIINISSIVGNLGFKELSGYASSKSALDGLTKSLAVEFSDKKIRVNSIAPGFIKSSYFQNFKKTKSKLYNWTLSRIPLNKWGENTDVANLTLFLLSEKSKYINGQIMIGFK